MRQRVIAHHPNERMAPDHLAPLFLRHSNAIPGCHYRVVHYEAEKRKERYLGTSEMMTCHYPGSRDGDAEDLAACLNLARLTPNVDNDQVVVWDVHNNNYPGLSYFSVGRRALSAAMAGAYLLGYDRCLVEPLSFYDCVPNAVTLETSLSDPGEYAAAARRLWSGFKEISKLSAEELEAKYREVAATKIRFYRKFEVPTLGPDGRVASYIPKLEAIEPAESFEPLDGLSRGILRSLGIPAGGRLLIGLWGHKNESKDLPAEGGRPRKLFFGSILQEIEPPKNHGNWAIFS